MPISPWFNLATIVVTNLAFILIALAVLIAVIKGQFEAVKEIMDGHFGKVLDQLSATNRNEGKLDALLQKQPNTVLKTEVIKDRRDENGENERRKDEK